MARTVASLAILGTASVILTASGQSIPPATLGPVPLTLGVPVEREIRGGVKHTFEIALERGEVATITVEQRSIDVIVEVIGADGGAMIDLDDAVGLRGKESIDVVAETTATHAVTVRPTLDPAPAGTYEIRLSERRPAAARDYSLHEVRKLRTRANRLTQPERLSDGLPLAERALALAEAVLEGNDVYVGLLALGAGLAREASADYPGAQRHYARAFEILTGGLGADHPHTARAQARLGAMHVNRGDYATAERLIPEALRRQEASLGTEHPLVALTLVDLGALSNNRGDFKTAERSYLRAADIFAKWFGTDDRRFAAVQTNLGALYLDKQDYQRAAPYVERAVAIREKLLGPEHPSLAAPLQNLGIIARERKDYAAAEQHYLRALAIREKSLGQDHPVVAGTINNLANLYGAQGDYARSLAMHLRALAISEKSANQWTQPILSLGNIARTYAALGDFANALAFQSRVEAALDADMALNLAIGSERQKIAYLSRIAERTERTLSFHLQLQQDNPEAAKLAAGALLQRKGRVLDAMTNTLAGFRLRAGADEQALLDRLAETTTRFAQLALAGPGKTPVEDHRKMLHDLDEARERLEVEVSQRSDEARFALQRVTLEAVQAAIPSGAALIEFAVYRPFNPKAESTTVAYGTPRYAVYVVRRNEIIGRDLGETAAVDAAIEDYRAALQDPARADLPRVSRTLDEKIMQPVRSVAAGATRLLISPDGQLALIPFEALVDERGRYLVERYPVSYVSAGRDLLRMQTQRIGGTASVVFADPLFGEPATTAATPVPVPAQRRRSVTNGAELASMYFAPLAGTLQEARSIQSVFPDTQIITGPQATESSLKRVKAPRILHIATHGFFIQEASASSRVENPLLRSGLALAAANHAAAEKDDGILTALEAAHLDLWGTKLVTLSACDTGVGVVRNGDGVYGLRRSIFLAGAETLVMSLWPVSDYITREMMTAYYKGLKSGLGRGEALRQVQLSMLKRKGREHPSQWASFIQAGDWASLDGRR
jgi:CHAT domain-containing protein/Tfp pilus assembly protein PilF